VWAKQQADAAKKAADAVKTVAPVAPKPPVKAPTKTDSPDTKAEMIITDAFLAAVEKLDITGLDEKTVGERAKILASLAGRLAPPKRVMKLIRDAEGVVTGVEG